MQRVTFKEEMDVLMLKEVLASQAFLQKSGLGWRAVTDYLLKLPSFPASLTSRTVRDRTNLLLNRYKRVRFANECSLSKEEVTDKTVILEELLALKAGELKTSLKEEEEEGDQNASEGRKKKEEEKAAEEAVPNQVLEDLRTMSSNGVGDSPCGSGTTSPSPALALSSPGSPSSPPADESVLANLINRGKKRKVEERMFLFLKEKEEQRKKEEEERLALKRMELELLRERQEEELRLKREAEEFARHERKQFFQMMQNWMQKIYEGK